jgi:hypothetical protein
MGGRKKEKLLPVPLAHHKSHMKCLDFELVRVRFVMDKVALGRKLT